MFEKWKAEAEYHSKKRSHHKKVVTPLDEAKSYIPPKKTKGRRTKQEQTCLDYLLIAFDAFSRYSHQGITAFDPKVSIKDLFFQASIPTKTFNQPVVTSRSQLTVSPHVITPVKGVLHPPKKQPETTVVNGFMSRESVFVPPDELDKDIISWLLDTEKKYRKIASDRKVEGKPWSYRLSQVSCGLGILATGKERVKSEFQYFVGAIYLLIQCVDNVDMLKSLGDIMDNLAYIDMLQEEAKYVSKGGFVSKHIQDAYETRYLELTV